MERIAYTPELKIVNTEYLPRGLGCKYLEVIRAHHGDLIAKAWHRAEPKDAAIVVEFSK